MWAVPTSYFLLNVLMCNRRCERRERCHFFFAWTRVRITQGESRRAYSQKGKTTRCGCCMAGSLEPPLWLARQVGLSFFSLNLFFFASSGTVLNLVGRSPLRLRRWVLLHSSTNGTSARDFASDDFRGALLYFTIWNTHRMAAVEGSEKSPHDDWSRSHQSTQPAALTCAHYGWSASNWELVI